MADKPAAPAPQPTRDPAGRFQPVSKPADSMADAMAMIASLENTDKGPPVELGTNDPNKHVPKPKDGTKPQDTNAEPVGETAEENEARLASEEAQRQAGEQPAKVKASTLRQTLDTTKAELTKAQARIKELETKSSEPSAEVKAAQEELANTKKRLAELEEDQRFNNYERSQEYKDKYEAPFVNAYQTGRNKVASLKMTDPASGEVRQGTKEDFDALMSISDDDAAGDFAAERWGNKAAVVMYHRERCNELNGARVQALDEYRKNGTARETQRQEQAKRSKAENAALWKQEIKSGEEKFSWSKAIEGDQKSREFLENGQKWADIAYGAPETDAEGKPVTRSPQDTAKLHAALYNKMRWFDHVAYLLNKERGTVKELRAKLKEYEASEPGRGDANGKPGTPALNAMDQVFADLQKRAR